ncbi:MAG: cytochrome c3 family protein [Rhodothermales bacterium]|nr:cytochrome c3 family protein [Rhodothermales bacterium]
MRFLFSRAANDGLLVWPLLFIGVLALAGCRQALSVVFDLPERQVAPAPSRLAVAPLATPLDDRPRPAIEATLVADSVVLMLPKDHAGNIDWMQALRDGTIRPRTALPGDSASLFVGTPFRFGFDFYFPGPASMFDAYFPHSAHTQWVACTQCHGPIFKYQDNEIQMADVFEGKFCGECHGKVAFPPITGCERCHQELPQPPDRAQPDLLGTIHMTRVDAPPVVADSAATDTSAIEQHLVSNASLPEAVFPHWVHRIRFTCNVCHTGLFEPKAGANAITMAQISAGEACGQCHDGKTAFAAGFGNCQRCHVEVAAP